MGMSSRLGRDAVLVWRKCDWHEVKRQTAAGNPCGGRAPIKVTAARSNMRRRVLFILWRGRGRADQMATAAIRAPRSLPLSFRPRLCCRSRSDADSSERPRERYDDRPRGPADSSPLADELVSDPRRLPLCVRSVELSRERVFSSARRRDSVHSRRVYWWS